MNYKEVLYPTVAKQLCELFQMSVSQQQEITHRIIASDLSYLTWQVIIDCLPLQLDQLRDMQDAPLDVYELLALISVVFGKQKLSPSFSARKIDLCRAYAGSFKHIAVMNDIAPARYGYKHHSTIL